MAITHIEYALIRRMKEGELLPSKPSLLELGQSNWYGDVTFETFVQDIALFEQDTDRAADLQKRAVQIAQVQGENWLFALADVFWEAFLGEHTYTAIDFDGVDDRAHPYDLNEPIPLTDEYDIVCNFGTAEHVFNIYQVFKTVHERTKVGGWMLHGLPFQGWVDHGFYTIQPTLYFDLVAANGYGEGVYLYAELQPPKVVQLEGRQTVHEIVERDELGANPMIFAAMRKLEDKPFKAPIQGYYDRRLDEQAAKRWETLR